MVRLRLVRDRGKYKKVFNFSSWVSLGAVASVGRNQGAALVVNAFFNTVMNTAMGVASSINSYVSIFAQTVKQPMAPQITKSYANGDHKRTDELLIMSTKYTFLLTLLIGSFFLVAPEWILSLWLGEAPPFASIFLVLFIIDNLVQSLNSGVGILILASGKIGFYQVSMSILNIFSVVLGYLVLRGGEPAYFLLVAYIVVSIITFFVIQFVLHRQLKYDNSKLWKYSFIPSLVVCALFVPVLFFPVIVHPIINIIISISYLCFIEFFVGLSKKEREKLRHIAFRGVSRIVKK
jgi:O-antigen/teichoic acid export membrane protein